MQKVILQKIKLGLNFLKITSFSQQPQIITQNEQKHKNVTTKSLFYGSMEENITTILCTHFEIYTNHGNIQFKCTGLYG